MRELIDIGLLLRRGSDVALALFFISRVTPETLVGELSIGPLPLPFFLFLVGFGLESLHAIVSRVDLIRGKAVAVTGLVFAITLSNGLYHQNSIRFVAIDSICLLAMVYGILWANARALVWIVNTTVYWFAAPVVCMSLISLVGMQMGWIRPAGESTRLYTYSEFDAIFVLSAFSPVCSLAIAAGRGTRGFGPWGVFVPQVVALALAMSTASRAGLACTLAAFVSVATLTFRGGSRIACVWGGAAIVLGFVYSGDHWIECSQLFRRVSTTEVFEEERYEEIGLMIDDLRGSELLGKGLGSQFATNIDAADRYAFAPHIGLLAMLHKGGVPMFLLIIVMPFTICVAVAGRAAVSDRWSEEGQRVRASFAWCVVVCCVQMSLSSGWNPLHLWIAAFAYARVFAGGTLTSPTTTATTTATLPVARIRENRRAMAVPSGGGH